MNVSCSFNPQISSLRVLLDPGALKIHLHVCLVFMGADAGFQILPHTCSTEIQLFLCHIHENVWVYRLKQSNNNNNTKTWQPSESLLSPSKPRTTQRKRNLTLHLQSKFILRATNQAEVFSRETQDLMIWLKCHQGNKPTDIHDAVHLSDLLSFSFQTCRNGLVLLSLQQLQSFNQKRFHYKKLVLLIYYIESVYIVLFT